MKDLSDNYNVNQQHYEQKYASVDANYLVKRVEKVNEFIDDATRTDTSWVGMYHGNFKDRLKGAKILEIGSGDGLNSLVMAALGANHVTAVDLAAPEQAIHGAAATLGLAESIKLMIGDFLSMPFEPASFDFVIGKAFLHHLTHEQEMPYLAKIASLLNPDGEARFFEPADNSKLLQTLQFAVPVPGRPSSLQRNAFARWKQNDPHPDRDNSSVHFIDLGKQFFTDVEIIPIGGIERFHRLLPQGDFNRKFRRLAYRIEAVLPDAIQSRIARSQTIIYRRPKRNPAL